MQEMGVESQILNTSAHLAETLPLHVFIGEIVGCQTVDVIQSAPQFWFLSSFFPPLFFLVAKGTAMLSDVKYPKSHYQVTS
jgi:hypothetical protein